MKVDASAASAISAWYVWRNLPPQKHRATFKISLKQKTFLCLQSINKTLEVCTLLKVTYTF